MFKRTKKDIAINVDEKLGQLFLGNKDLRLLMLRPIDLIEFAEFAGSSAEDILLWTGKTVGKHLSTQLIPDVNWENESLSIKKKAIRGILDTLEHLGFGVLRSKFAKDNVEIHVHEPLSESEKENIMAKNICRLYQGVFNGLFENMEVAVDAEEISCCLLDDDACVFKYTLLDGEFDDADIDPEDMEDQEKYRSLIPID
ncbi:MAG: hypothetical protein ACFFBP_16155 [Promethearchaeota archaeon]